MAKNMFVVISLAAALLESVRVSFSQEPAPTRIAVINFGEVLQNYGKFKDSKKNYEAVLGPYKALSDKLAEESKKLQQTATDPKADMETKKEVDPKNWTASGAGIR
jgi:Skp family chaperone for outer membrane proteins